MNLKMSSAKWRPFCFGLNVLKDQERSNIFHDMLTANGFMLIKSSSFVTLYG